jgi:hypothetical protein
MHELTCSPCREYSISHNSLHVCLPSIALYNTSSHTQQNEWKDALPWCSLHPRKNVTNFLNTGHCIFVIIIISSRLSQCVICLPCHCFDGLCNTCHHSAQNLSSHLYLETLKIKVNYTVYKIIILLVLYGYETVSQPQGRTQFLFKNNVVRRFKPNNDQNN